MISENALKILNARYLKKDDNGKVIESPNDMFKRVADFVSDGDKIKAKEFFIMMSELDFLPNSPTLMNAGKPLGQLSACFVLPIEDNTESIFDAIKYAALIHKSGGGTGFSFSKIRPSGSVVKSTQGVASGPISFLKVFNAATECIKQGGTRRGANMGILRVDHPDILEFIKCKSDNKDITSFNLSIAITDKFMDAVRNNTIYNLIDPSTGKVVGDLMAKEVFDLIVESSFKNGEPGIIFIDEINRHNPTPWLGDIDSTNPCGEQPLLPFESCNLGSINLSNMIHYGDFNVHWGKLQRVVRTAVNFLDNVITVNNYPLPEIEQMTKNTRKIGLGVMGWADMLIKLEIPYDSKEALILADKVMKYIDDVARDESIKLAEEKGKYPASKINQENDIRNATRTTIAPTGTLSIIANVSSGIEPLFAIAFERNQADMKMLDVNPLFKKAMALANIPLSISLVKEIMDKGSIQNIDAIPKEIKRVFLTAHDVHPDSHIHMQAAFQEHTNNAVSKTINLPHTATKDDIAKVFLLAHETKCKGFTVYVDGSRDNQVLTTGSSYVEKVPDTLQVTIPRERPAKVTGFTEKIKTGCGNLYITVNKDDKGICEVFTNNGRSGGCHSQSEAISRLVSVALRSNVEAKVITAQLKGIRCPATQGKGLKCTSCPDAIGRIIESLDNEKVPEEVIEDFQGKKDFLTSINRCPNCGFIVTHEGGCVICKNCGESKCG